MWCTVVLYLPPILHSSRPPRPRGHDPTAERDEVEPRKFWQASGWHGRVSNCRTVINVVHVEEQSLEHLQNWCQSHRPQMDCIINSGWSHSDVTVLMSPVTAAITGSYHLDSCRVAWWHIQIWFADNNISRPYSFQFPLNGIFRWSAETDQRNVHGAHTSLCCQLNSVAAPPAGRQRVQQWSVVFTANSHVSMLM